MRKVFKIIIVFIYCFFTTPSFGQWQQTNGPSGRIHCIETTSSDIFIGTDFGVFQSSNDGTSWSKVFDRYCTSIAIDGSSMYAGTVGSGIFSSNDNGQNWNSINTGITSVRCLYANGPIILAGTTSGITKFDGTSWMMSNNGLTNTIINSIISVGSAIFIGTYGGVFVSNDNGNNWSHVSNGLTWSGYIFSLTTDGTDIYAGTQNGVYKTTTMGNSWIHLNNGLSNVSILAVKLLGTSIIAGSGNSGIYISNNGSAWSPYNSGLLSNNIMSLAIKGAKIFAGSKIGMFCSTDFGNTWLPINSGLQNSTIMTMELNSSQIYTGTWGSVFSSSNFNDWNIKNAGLIASNGVYSLLIDSPNVLAGTSDGVFLSIDEGSSWTAMNNGLGLSNVRALAYDGSNLYAGTQWDGMFISNNYGNSWTPINNGLTNLGVNDIQFRNSTLFVATVGGIFFSADNGNSWTHLNNQSIDAKCMAFIGSNLFVGTIDDGVYLSTNMGPLTPINNGVTALDIESIDTLGTQLFIGTFGGGVLTSLDSGSNWVPINSSLQTLKINVVKVGLSELFAGTYDGGVWKLPLPACIPISTVTNNANQIVTSPSSALFTVDVIGSNPSYQWQYLPVGGSWTDLVNGSNTTWTTNGNSSTLTFSNTDASQDQYQFRCVISNGCSSQISTPQLLTINTGCIPVSSATTSGNQSVITPASATFTVSVLGTSPAYQWQELMPAGTWMDLTSGPNVSGETTASLMLSNTNISQTNYQYRCIVSNSCPSSLTSTPQTLTVSSACIPVSGGATNGNQSVFNQASATFTVSVLGTSPAYQWQELMPAGTWTNLTSGPNVNGETTASLMLTNTNVSQTNYQYRCIVSNSCPSSLTSTPQTLTVSSACIPVSGGATNGNQSVITPASATFTVSVLGTSPTYQWQQLIPAGTWTNLTLGPNVTGETTASMMLSNTNISQTNYQYRCIVSNSCPSSLTSTPQSLTVSSACIPVSGGATNGNQSVITPASATFTVSVLGTSPAYQWQQLIPAGTWTNLISGPNVTGETTASMMLSNTNISQTNYQYRCIVSNSCPSSLTSTPQSLTVSSACIPVSGGATNGNQSVFSLASATFTVSVLGTSPNYQWQQLIPLGSWTNLTVGPNVTGVTTSTLVLSNTTTTQNNYQFRCIVTNTCPSSLTSIPQTLTVLSPPTYWIGFNTRVEGNEELDWELEIAQGTSLMSSPPPAKICADGSKATIIYFNCSDLSIDMQDIRFRVANFNNIYDDGNFSLSDYNSNQTTAIVKYSHPQSMNQSALYASKTIEVYNQNNPSLVLLSYPVRIYRAPVLMVHGLWGNENTFYNMEANLINSNLYPAWYGSSDLIFRLDYEESNDYSLEENSHTVPSGINSLLYNVRQSFYSAGKAIVIAHSMGGLLTRLYFENLYNNIYRNDIQKYITLNTPHSGTQGADMLWHRYVRCNFVRASMTTPHRYGCPPAIEDMRVNSQDIQQLNNVTNLNANLIPSFSIVTEDAAFTDSDCNDLITELIEPLADINSNSNGDKSLYMGNLYSNNPSDLIVPMLSQDGGMSESQSYTGQCHLRSPSDPTLIAKVKELIDFPATSSFFDVNGFTPINILTPPSIYFRSSHAQQTYSVEILSPTSGSSFTAGSNITISTIGDSSTKNLVVYIGNNKIQNFTQLYSAANNTISYTIPNDALGTILIAIIGIDTTGVESMDTVTIEINTTASLDSMTFYPRLHYIPIFDSRKTKIIGHFSDGIDRDLTNVSGLDISIADTLISKLSINNTVEAIDTGITFATYTYQGINKNIDIIVYEGEAWLTTDIKNENDFNPNQAGNIKSNVSLYPNPSDGIFTIRSENIVGKEVKVFVSDVYGKTLHDYCFNITNGKLNETFNLTDIKPGLFIISVIDQSYKNVIRYIKQ